MACFYPYTGCRKINVFKSCREKSQESRKNKIKNIEGVFYIDLKVQSFIMFSSNKKYEWLTFILKYGEDDYVKY
jgi:hypothetical protein